MQFWSCGLISGVSTNGVFILTSRLGHVWLCDVASPIPSWHRLRRGAVTFCDSTLNTANLYPAISVVGLFYLLTVIMNFVCRFILGVDFTRRFRFCMCVSKTLDILGYLISLVCLVVMAGNCFWCILEEMFLVV